MIISYRLFSCSVVSLSCQILELLCEGDITELFTEFFCVVYKFIKIFPYCFTDAA